MRTRTASVIASVVLSLVAVAGFAPAPVAADTPFVLHVPVLMYHRIQCAAPGQRLAGLFLCPALLDAQMALLEEQGWHSITGDQLADDMTNHVCPGPKTVVITDDDGALDNYLYGAPIWEIHGFRATFAMVVGKAGDYLNGYTGQKPHFSWDQARDLVSRGFGIADHTMFHTDVSHMTTDQLDDAVQQAQDIIDEQLGFYPKVFVYPYGSAGDQTVADYLAARFTLAFTTANGATESTSDPMYSPRVRVAGTEQPAGVLRALNQYANPCAGSAPPSTASLAPKSHAFGTVAPSTQSAPKTFSITNNGSGTVDVASVSLGGVNDDQFSISNNGCQDAALTAQTSCTVTVVFAPTQHGTMTAELDVSTDATKGSSLIAKLSGTGGTPTNGSITVQLLSHPSADKAVSFTGSNGIGSFSLNDVTGSGDETTFSEPAGSYSITASQNPGWSLVALSCDSPEVINASQGSVAISLADSEDVTCTFTTSKRVPDAAIGTSQSGPFVGTGLLNHRVKAAQTSTMAIGPRQTSSFFVPLTNNGLDADTYAVHGRVTQSGGFSVAYFYNGTNVTSAVRAGSWSFALAPGAQRLLEVRVTGGALITSSSWANINVRLRSTTATVSDVVHGHVAGT